MLHFIQKYYFPELSKSSTTYLFFFSLILKNKRSVIYLWVGKMAIVPFFLTERWSSVWGKICNVCKPIYLLVCLFKYSRKHSCTIHPNLNLKSNPIGNPQDSFPCPWRSSWMYRTLDLRECSDLCNFQIDVLACMSFSRKPLQGSCLHTGIQSEISNLAHWSQVRSWAWGFRKGSQCTDRGLALTVVRGPGVLQAMLSSWGPELTTPSYPQAGQSQEGCQSWKQASLSKSGTILVRVFSLLS